MQVSVCSHCGKPIIISDNHSAQLSDLHEECLEKLSQAISSEKEKESEDA